MIKRLFGKWSFWIGLVLAGWPILFAAWCGVVNGESAAREATIIFSTVALGGWILRSAYGNCRDIEIRSPAGYIGLRNDKENGDVVVTFERKES